MGSVLESCLSEKDLGTLVGSQLNIRQQCAGYSGQMAEKTNSFLVCIRSSVASRPREVIVPLYLALALGCTPLCVQLWSPHYKKVTEVLEHVRRRTMKLVKGLESKSHEGSCCDAIPEILKRRVDVVLSYMV